MRRKNARGNKNKTRTLGEEGVRRKNTRGNKNKRRTTWRRRGKRRREEQAQGKTADIRILPPANRCQNTAHEGALNKNNHKTQTHKLALKTYTASQH